MKAEKKPISMITAYSYPQGLIVDEAGIDIILVGDSLGMVELGYQDTVPVTMDEMLMHTKSVMRAVKRAHVVGDLPFMSYNISTEQAVTNAGILYKDGGADSVKLEGGQEMADKVAFPYNLIHERFKNLYYAMLRAAGTDTSKVYGHFDAYCEYLLTHPDDLGGFGQPPDLTGFSQIPRVIDQNLHTLFSPTHGNPRVVQ